MTTTSSRPTHRTAVVAAVLLVGLAGCAGPEPAADPEVDLPGSAVVDEAVEVVTEATVQTVVRELQRLQSQGAVDLAVVVHTRPACDDSGDVVGEQATAVVVQATLDGQPYRQQLDLPRPVQAPLEMAGVQVPIEHRQTSGTCP